MDLAKVLAQLRAELENIDAAIASLERISQGVRRRGRPFGTLNKARLDQAGPEAFEPDSPAEPLPRRPRREP